MVYFAITTQGPWRTAASAQEFDVLIDANNDNEPDLALFNTRLADSDVMVDELIDLNTGDVLDAEPINDRFGDTDTALFDSDTMVMPVALAALGLNPANPRLHYGVVSFSPYQSDPIDLIGLNANGEMHNPLSFNAFRPGVAVFGSYDGSASALLYADSPGSVLAVRRDTAAYAADHALGALIVHYQNKVGTKAQKLALKSASAVSIKLSKTTVKLHGSVSASISVASTGGPVPTGQVDLRHMNGAHGIYSIGHLSNGKVTLKFTPKTKGTILVRAEYHGDGSYLAGHSATVKVVVS
jgi:hypothetical protein